MRGTLDAPTIAYCRDKAAPPGSDLHYALLMAEHRQRGPLLAVWALWVELSNVPVTVSDADVAQRKLQWWREELQRAADGGGDHPVSQLLVATNLLDQRRQADTRELLDGIEEELVYHAYPDEAALLAHAHRSGAPLGRLLARASAPDSTAADDSLHHFGIAFRLQQLLLRARASIACGRCHLPEDALRAAGIDRDALHAERTSAALAAVFDNAAQRIETLYAQAVDCLPAEHWRTQRSSRALAALQRALLDELRSGGFPLLEQRTELTPLRRLWIAWRAAQTQPRSS